VRQDRRRDRQGAENGRRSGLIFRPVEQDKQARSDPRLFSLSVLQIAPTANSPGFQPELIIGARMKRRLTSLLVHGAFSTTPPSSQPKDIELINAGLMLCI
jgi:hypothetical protein